MIPQNCQKTRPLDESKFAQNIKIMSPTPKYFRSELNTHHDQILHSPNQKAFERNINFNKNGKSPGFTTVNNFSNKIM